MADELKFAVRCGGSTKKKANKNNSDIYLPFDSINLTATPILTDLTTSKNELLSKSEFTSTTNNDETEIVNSVTSKKKPELLIVENGASRNLASNIPFKPKIFKEDDDSREENAEEPVPVDVFNSHKKITKKLNVTIDDNNKAAKKNISSTSFKDKNQNNKNNVKKSSSIHYLENNNNNMKISENNTSNESHELLNLERNFNKNNKIYYH